MRAAHTQIRTGFILVIASALLHSGCGVGTGHSLNNQPGASNPAPTIKSISPSSAISGQGVSLTLIGTNFMATSVISFNGRIVATGTRVSSTQLNVNIPAGTTSAGAVEVTVSNPAPGGGTSNAVTLTVINPVPTISAISPSSIAGSGNGFTLTVFGWNFVTGSVVNWGTADNLATSFVNSTQLTAIVPSSDLTLAGTVAVNVTNPAPGGGTSNIQDFSITSDNAVPTIDYLDPGCAPVGVQALTLYVNGSNFMPGSIVRWNGSDLPTTFNASSYSPWLTAQVSAADIATSGTADITVFNPAPGGGSSGASSFTVGSLLGPASIVVDPSGKFVYVADEGCPDVYDGFVSVYGVDSSSGALTPVTSPVDTGDEGAISVAVDPLGKFVYVANWGEGDTAGSISMYSINGTTGALTSIGYAYGECPGLCAPTSIAVDPSGRFSYAANEGGLAPTGVSMFTIDSTNGSLSPIGIVDSGGRAWRVTVDPKGKFAYVTSYPGYASPGISMYSINTTTGALTSIGTISESYPVEMAIHPLGKFSYVTNTESDNVEIFTIDPTTGTLKQIGTAAAGSGPSSIAIHPSGGFVYVTNVASNDISMYTIDATTGALTPIGTISAEESPVSVAIHPSGKFAYVANADSNSISIYSIDGTTGLLTLIGTIGP